MQVQARMTKYEAKACKRALCTRIPILNCVVMQGTNIACNSPSVSTEKKERKKKQGKFCYIQVSWCSKRDMLHQVKYIDIFYCHCIIIYSGAPV